MQLLLDSTPFSSSLSPPFITVTFSEKPLNFLLANTSHRSHCVALYADPYGVRVFLPNNLSFICPLSFPLADPYGVRVFFSQHVPFVLADSYGVRVTFSPNCSRLIPLAFPPPLPTPMGLCIIRRFLDPVLHFLTLTSHSHTPSDFPTPMGHEYRFPKLPRFEISSSVCLSQWDMSIFFCLSNHFPSHSRPPWGACISFRFVIYALFKAACVYRLLWSTSISLPFPCSSCPDQFSYLLTGPYGVRVSFPLHPNHRPLRNWSLWGSRTVPDFPTTAPGIPPLPLPQGPMQPVYQTLHPPIPSAVFHFILPINRRLQWSAGISSSFLFVNS
jgi:hypothetical protein